jgi:hypothetical protein
MLPCSRCRSPVLPRSSCPACGGAPASSSAAVALLGLIMGSPLVACQEIYGFVPMGEPVGPGPDLLAPVDLQLGDVALGEVATGEVVVQNIGEAILEVTAVGVAEPAAGFEVVAPALPAELEPGEKLTLEVAFAPEALGPATAALTVSSTDDDTPEALVDLSGRGVP